MTPRKPATVKPTKQAADAPVQPPGGQAPAAASSSSTGPKVGALVAYTYRDDYAGAGGEDVTNVGIVTAVGPDGALVSWLTSTDPIPTDQLTVL